MAFKKVVPPKVSSEPVGALLQVLPEQDELTVMGWLREQGATEIEQLAPGFLSVVAPPTSRAAPQPATTRQSQGKSQPAVAPVVRCSNPPTRW